MAIAWSATITKATVFGDQRVFYVTLTSPASGNDTYTTGGDTLAPSLVGLDYIDFVNCNLVVPTGQATAYIPNITPNGDGNAKLQLFGGASGSGAALAEVSGSTAIASYTILCQFFGV